MKPVSNTLLNLALGLVLGLLIAGQFAFDKPLFRNEKTSAPAARITAPPLPQQLSFAGESVPLARWDVKERLEREVLLNYFNNANVLFLVKNANRYFPAIEARLKANGVPDDFKYLCIAESNLIPSAISSSGAVSFWQFLNGTAPGYGLEVNKEVDQRYDLAKATDAACAYLKSAYSKFGSWTAAAASYNCGQGGYNGQATYQGSNNYYDLLLPEETNRYIFRILAFKYLLEKAPELGFEVPEAERYTPAATRIITVSNSISRPGSLCPPARHYLQDVAPAQPLAPRPLTERGHWQDLYDTTAGGRKGILV
jgi:membrane-bound lytic murein transglycosylase D